MPTLRTRSLKSLSCGVMSTHTPLTAFVLLLYCTVNMYMLGREHVHVELFENDLMTTRKRSKETNSHLKARI